MSISIGDIMLMLGADDSPLKETLGRAEKNAQGWVNSLGSKIAMGIGAAVTTAIGGAVALGASAFKAGEQLDAAYDKILINTGATGDALTQLQADFKAVFTSVPTEAGPAADVLSLIYSRLGLTGEAAQSTTTKVLEMSRLMGGDAKANAESLTRALKDAFGSDITPENTANALDMMFVASQKSGIGISRLADLMTQYGAKTRAFGFDTAETISLLAKWEKEGVNTELVLGSLGIAANKFASENKPLKESLMATFDAIKNAKTESEAFNLAADVFGARSGPDMAAAIRENRFEIDDMINALYDSKDAITNTANATMDWGEKLQILKNKATTALAPLGMKLMDLASTLLDKAGPALDWFSKIIDQYVVPAIDSVMASFANFNGDPIGAIADILYTLGYNLETVFGIEGANDFFSNIGDGFISLSNTISAFVNDTLLPFVEQHWPEIKAALIAIGVALGAAAIVSTVMGIATAIGSLLNPVGAVIAIVALLAAAWAGDWGGIQEKTFAAIEWLKTTIATGMQFISDFMNGDLGLLSQIFATAWQNIQLIFQAFQAAFSGDWYRFGELLRQAWDNSWKLMGTILSTAWENIKTGVKNGIQAVGDFFTKTDWGKVGRSIIEGIANGLSAAGGVLVTAAQKAAQAAYQAILGFFGAGGSSSSSASTTPAPTVGHKASGGNVSAGAPYKVGEFGPEIFVPSQSGSIIPNSAMGSGSAPIQFTFVDQSFISSTDELEAEQKLAPIVRRIMRGVVTA